MGGFKVKFKFGEINVMGWIVLGALLLLAGILLALGRKKVHFTTRMLVNAALCIAISFVLGYIRLFRMPQGGSITPASMLPLIAFAWYYGIGPGTLTGIAYGILQLIQDAYILSPIQAILDYPLAFAMIGLAGLFRNGKGPELLRWFLGILCVGVGRFICHTLSGVVFFASYAEGSGLSPLAYSLLYNTYLFVDLAVCFAIILFPQIRKALSKMNS